MEEGTEDRTDEFQRGWKRSCRKEWRIKQGGMKEEIKERRKVFRGERMEGKRGKEWRVGWKRKDRGEEESPRKRGWKRKKNKVRRIT